MPRRCETVGVLPGLIAAQDYVVHRDQALLGGLTRDAIGHRLRTRQWSLVLPDVYLTHQGEPSRRQRLWAALLYAGPASAIDGVDACSAHGLTSVRTDPHKVHVVIPQDGPARSRGFVVVRRSQAEIRTVSKDMLRYLEPAGAVVAATRAMRNSRSVLATYSEAVQRRITTHDALLRAHVEGPPRNSRAGDAALAAIGAGIRSAPEDDFRKLVDASLILPAAEYNVWLRLPSGRVVCVDALFRTSGVVHETNGRAFHAREDLFESMQERHDELTAAGLIALHNPPIRLRGRPREAIAQVERCHVMYDGRGMPAGIEILPRAS